MMKESTRYIQKKYLQNGVSMLEVLIALLITTVGLLGFANLQSRALVSTEDTYQRTLATGLAQDIIERMRMNGVAPGAQSNAAASVADYTTASNWTSAALPSDGDCFGINKNCTTAQMARYDIIQVRRALEAALPAGKAVVASCANNRVCAYIAWGGVSATDCAAANGIGLKTCVVIQGA